MNDRAPIVHVVAAGEIGGAERMLLDLARPGARGRQRPHTVALFTPNPALRALFEASGIPLDDRGPVREGPLTYLTTSLGRGDVRWLEGVIRRRGGAIVHLHTFASQVLGTRAARAAGARVVRTEHSTRVYEDPSCWPFSRWSLERADGVVCVSEHVRRVALRRARFARKDWGERLQVIHNGIDTERFSPRPPPSPAPSADGSLRFVSVGRLDRRKGLDLALEALALVPRAELEIVGEGEPVKAELVALAAALGVGHRVRFTGYADDVRLALARADVALSSAREEGLGIALLEAMAMGLPVVAVPVGGIPEIVGPRTGWLAGARSVTALAAAMRAAAESPDERRLRGQAAREHVRRRFSIEAMCTAYERVYQRLTA